MKQIRSNLLRVWLGLASGLLEANAKQTRSKTEPRTRTRTHVSPARTNPHLGASPASGHATMRPAAGNACHHPHLYSTGRHGCWCACICGWTSDTYTTTTGAHLAFGEHLTMVATNATD